MIIALMAIMMTSFRWADQLGFGVIWRNPLAFYAFVIVVLLIAGWTVSLTGIAVLRCAFRVTGMLNRDEAQYYPLRADKKRVDPWPETWQKPEIDDSKQCATEQVRL
jgi:hypothetical protein